MELATYATTVTETLGELVIDLLARHVPEDREGLNARDEAQVTLVALGNLAALSGRTDLREMLYALSDRTGGRAAV